MAIDNIAIFKEFLFYRIYTPYADTATFIGFYQKEMSMATMM